jgi:tetratricopeptide (TPR) repeat protein
MYWRVVKCYDTHSQSTKEQVLKSLDSLAQVLARQDKLGEAEEMGRWMVQERQNCIGEDHLDTLIGLHTLADILFRRGKFEEAITLYERAYVETQKRLGSEHPDTIEFLRDLEITRHKMNGNTAGL